MKMSNGEDDKFFEFYEDGTRDSQKSKWASWANLTPSNPQFRFAISTVFEISIFELSF